MCCTRLCTIHIYIQCEDSSHFFKCDAIWSKFNKVELSPKYRVLEIALHAHKTSGKDVDWISIFFSVAQYSFQKSKVSNKFIILQATDLITPKYLRAYHAKIMTTYWIYNYLIWTRAYVRNFILNSCLKQ